jgi:hypothetical protein
LSKSKSGAAARRCILAHSAVLSRFGDKNNPGLATGMERVSAGHVLSKGGLRLVGDGGRVPVALAAAASPTPPMRPHVPAGRKRLSAPSPDH